MDLDEYQNLAYATDHTPGDGEFKTAVQVLALQSKVGNLSVIFKRYYRKQRTRRGMSIAIRDSLGDILWYIAAVANSSGLKLSDIAKHNLESVNRLYGTKTPTLFDPQRFFVGETHEQFPDKMTFQFFTTRDLTARKIKQTVILGPDGQQFGDPIDDNEYKDDYYRFHDPIHICFMTYVGWSPVMRKLLGIKRKSNALIDRVEDGAKARDIEEGIAKRVFAYMQDNNMLEGIEEVDSDLLREIPLMLGERESAWVAEASWQTAIMRSAQLIRALVKNSGGILSVNLIEQEVAYSVQTDTGA
ncbi:hypothetical protein [Sandaracinobacteroides saxicola]|uniref:MazG C-terminal domain-containing protein n=1 Tax=Sandaracinobacteroides saxicola TaxID=2759707 RepID=A0A7G5IJT5_9SPHN|nr:hypothetical protein [Sandaracinobacteroides saxicola]QMW23627.1 hypothetical protein H3309_03815 [Sandaracinobacteroides saxicola]